MDELTPFVERRSPRREVFLAAMLEAATRSRLAITQNLSRTGALLLSIGRFEPGEVLDVSLLPGRDQAAVRARGRVVRSKPFSENGPWRCALAVQFDEPLLDATATRLIHSI